MKFDFNKRVADARRLQDVAALIECRSGEEEVQCLINALQSFFSIDPTSSNAETCAALKSTIEAQVQCVNECELLDCSKDAELLINTVAFQAGVDFQLECGGIDFQQTCETGELISNGAPAAFPLECLDDESVRACRNEVEESDYVVDYDQQDEICDFAPIARKVEDLVCLKQCETFRCSDVPESGYDLLTSNLRGLRCGLIDFEESCEQEQAVELPDDQQDPDNCLGEDKFLSCLDGTQDVIDQILNENGEALDCETFETLALDHNQCFKDCNGFNCAVRKVLHESFFIGTGCEPNELQCVDPPETEEPTSQPTQGPTTFDLVDCLVDESIKQCHEEAEAFLDDFDFTAANGDCNSFVEAYIAKLKCLKECEGFSCAETGKDVFEFLSLAIPGTLCQNIDLEASCELGEIVGGAEGLRMGFAALMGVAAMTLKLIH